jgi:hypothetical protein
VPVKVCSKQPSVCDFLNTRSSITVTHFKTLRDPSHPSSGKIAILSSLPERTVISRPFFVSFLLWLKIYG